MIQSMTQRCKQNTIQSTTLNTIQNLIQNLTQDWIQNWMIKVINLPVQALTQHQNFSIELPQAISTPELQSLIGASKEESLGPSEEIMAISIINNNQELIEEDMRSILVVMLLSLGLHCLHSLQLLQELISNPDLHKEIHKGQLGTNPICHPHMSIWERNIEDEFIC